MLCVWAVLSTAGFLYALFFRLPAPSSWRASLLLVGITALIARLVPILLYPDSVGFAGVDIRNYATTAQAVLDRQDVYEVAARLHPYPPLHMYAFALAKWATVEGGPSFFTLVRLPQVAADVASAMLIADAVRRRSTMAAGQRAGLAFALCPLSILVTSYHGQFDAASIFFALLAYWALGRANGSALWLSVSAGALGLGAMEKLWPALLLPLFLLALTDSVQRAQYAAVFTGVCAALLSAYIVVFDSSLGAIADALTSYAPAFRNATGLGLVVDRTIGSPADGFLDWFHDDGQTLAVVLAMLAALFAAVRGLSLEQSMVLVLVALLLATPSAGAHHVTWIVPFALVANSRRWVCGLVLVTAASYGSLLLLDAGLYIPAHIDNAFTDAVRDRRWRLDYIAWLIFGGWFVWIVWNSFANEPARRPT